MAIHINPRSPVAVSVFGLDIRWYALAYVVSFIVIFWLLARLMRNRDSGLDLDKKQYDDFLTYIVFGVIIGGRFGYVLFYNLPYFLFYIKSQLLSHSLYYKYMNSTNLFIILAK